MKKQMTALKKEREKKRYRHWDQCRRRERRCSRCHWIQRAWSALHEDPAGHEGSYTAAGGYSLKEAAAHSGAVRSWRTGPHGTDPYWSCSWRTTAHGKDPPLGQFMKDCILWEKLASGAGEGSEDKGVADDSVLILSVMELILFLVADMVLYFEFRMRIMLVTF